MTPSPADGQPLHCGWPFRLAQSSTVVFCGLPLGHDGPLCRLLAGDGTTVAAAPRFGVQLPTEPSSRPERGSGP